MSSDKKYALLFLEVDYYFMQPKFNYSLYTYIFKQFRLYLIF